MLEQQKMRRSPISAVVHTRCRQFSYKETHRRTVWLPCVIVCCRLSGRRSGGREEAAAPRVTAYDLSFDSLKVPEIQRAAETPAVVCGKK